MKTITLIDTYNCGLNFEDVEDFCLNNDMEIPEEGSAEDFEIRDRMKEMDIEDFWDNLKYTNKLDACVVMGKLGLWNGGFEIEPKVFNSLYDAVLACARDAWDIVVRQNHSTIEVDAMHHDGTNHFEIRLLNGKGYDAWNKNRYEYAHINLSRRCYHETLKDYIF